MVLILLLAVFGLSVVAFCSLQVRRYVTILTGALLAIFIGFMSGKEAAIVIAALTILLVIGQICIPLVHDFLRTLFGLPQDKLKRVLGYTVIRSIPVLCICFGLLYLSHVIAEVTYSKTVYAIPIDVTLGCQDQERSLLVCDSDIGDISFDTDSAISRVFDRFHGKVNDISKEYTVIDSETAKQEFARKLSGKLFGTNGLLKDSICHFGEDTSDCTETCSIFQWALSPLNENQCLRRSAIAKIDQIYKGHLSEAKTAFGQAVNDVDKDRVDALVLKKLNAVSSSLTKSQASVRAGNARLFLVLRAMNIISLAAFCLLFLKLILFIYMRFLFHADFGAQKISYTKKLEEHGDDIDVQIYDHTENPLSDNQERFVFKQPFLNKSWYVALETKLKPYRQGETTYPRPLTFTWPRVLTGKIKFMRYPKQDATDTFFGATGDSQIKCVKVSLPAGRRMAIQLNHLIAFCENIKMRSVFDVKLSLLVQRRFLLRVVEGPGDIILSGRDGVIMRQSGPGGSGMDPSNVIAFDLDGEFELDAAHGWFSTYEGDYSLLSAENSTMIATSSDQQRSTIFRKLRRALFIVLPV